MTGTRTEQIKAMLERAFATARVTVSDDSALHVGHAGARDGAGHFFVRIESQDFDRDEAASNAIAWSTKRSPRCCRARYTP